MENTSTSPARIPRAATAAEVEELRVYAQKTWRCLDFADDAYIAVFDDYMTGDDTEYEGKLLVLVAGDWPFETYVFCWNDGAIDYCDRD